MYGYEYQIRIGFLLFSSLVPLFFRGGTPLLCSWFFPSCSYHPFRFFFSSLLQVDSFSLALLYFVFPNPLFHFIISLLSQLFLFFSRLLRITHYLCLVHSPLLLPTHDYYDSNLECVPHLPSVHYLQVVHLILLQTDHVASCCPHKKKGTLQLAGFSWFHCIFPTPLPTS